MAEADSFYPRAERWIEYGTLVLGAMAAVFAAVKWGWPHAAGVLLGALLAWINFRWMKQGLDVMAELAVAQPDAEKARIPKRVYVKFFARYALILLVLYAILRGSILPAAAVFVGLFTLVGAVLVVMVWQLLRGPGRPGAL